MKSNSGGGSAVNNQSEIENIAGAAGKTGMSSGGVKVGSGQSTPQSQKQSGKGINNTHVGANKVSKGQKSTPSPSDRDREGTPTAKLTPSKTAVMKTEEEKCGGKEKLIISQDVKTEDQPPEGSDIQLDGEAGKAGVSFSFNKRGKAKLVSSAPFQKGAIKVDNGDGDHVEQTDDPTSRDDEDKLTDQLMADADPSEVVQEKEPCSMTGRRSINLLSSFVKVKSKDEKLELNWPAEMVQYTKAEPPISFSCNPLCFDLTLLLKGTSAHVSADLVVKHVEKDASDDKKQCVEMETVAVEKQPGVAAASDVSTVDLQVEDKTDDAGEKAEGEQESKPRGSGHKKKKRSRKKKKRRKSSKKEPADEEPGNDLESKEHKKKKKKKKKRRHRHHDETEKDAENKDMVGENGEKPRKKKKHSKEKTVNPTVDGEEGAMEINNKDEKTKHRRKKSKKSSKRKGLGGMSVEASDIEAEQTENKEALVGQDHVERQKRPRHRTKHRKSKKSKKSHKKEDKVEGDLIADGSSQLEKVETPNKVAKTKTSVSATKSPVTGLKSARSTKSSDREEESKLNKTKASGGNERKRKSSESSISVKEEYLCSDPKSKKVKPVTVKQEPTADRDKSEGSKNSECKESDLKGRLPSVESNSSDSKSKLVHNEEVHSGKKLPRKESKDNSWTAMEVMYEEKTEEAGSKPSWDTSDSEMDDCSLDVKNKKSKDSDLCVSDKKKEDKSHSQDASSAGTEKVDKSEEHKPERSARDSKRSSSHRHRSYTSSRSSDSRYSTDSYDSRSYSRSSRSYSRSRSHSHRRRRSSSHSSRSYSRSRSRSSSRGRSRRKRSYTRSYSRSYSRSSYSSRSRSRSYSTLRSRSRSSRSRSTRHRRSRSSSYSSYRSRSKYRSSKKRYHKKKPHNSNSDSSDDEGNTSNNIKETKTGVEGGSSMELVDIPLPVELSFGKDDVGPQAQRLLQKIKEKKEMLNDPEKAKMLNKDPAETVVDKIAEAENKNTVIGPKIDKKGKPIIDIPLPGSEETADINVPQSTPINTSSVLTDITKPPPAFIPQNSPHPSQHPGSSSQQMPLLAPPPPPPPGAQLPPLQRPPFPGNHRLPYHGNARPPFMNNRPPFPGMERPRFPGSDGQFSGGERPRFPMGDRPGFPRGDRPHFMGGERPRFPGGDRLPFPGGDRMPFPGGERPFPGERQPFHGERPPFLRGECPYPGNEMPHFPGPGRMPFPGGDRPPYPGPYPPPRGDFRPDMCRSMPPPGYNRGPHPGPRMPPPGFGPQGPMMPNDPRAPRPWFDPSNQSSMPGDGAPGQKEAPPPLPPPRSPSPQPPPPPKKEEVQVEEPTPMPPPIIIPPEQEEQYRQLQAQAQKHAKKQQRRQMQEESGQPIDSDDTEDSDAEAMEMEEAVAEIEQEEDAQPQTMSLIQQPTLIAIPNSQAVSLQHQALLMSQGQGSPLMQQMLTTQPQIMISSSGLPVMSQAGMPLQAGAPLQAFAIPAPGGGHQIVHLGGQVPTRFGLPSAFSSNAAAAAAAGLHIPGLSVGGLSMSAAGLHIPGLQAASGLQFAGLPGHAAFSGMAGAIPGIPGQIPGQLISPGHALSHAGLQFASAGHIPHHPMFAQAGTPQPIMIGNQILIPRIIRPTL